MAFARDKVSTNGSGNLTLSVSVNFNTLPATNSFIVFTCWNTSNEIPTVSDNAGNTYLNIISVLNNPDLACHAFYTNYALKSMTGLSFLQVTAQATSTHFWGAQAASYTQSTPGTVIADMAAINSSTGIASGFGYNSGSPAQIGELFVSAMGQNSENTNEGVFLGGTGNPAPYVLVGTPINNGATGEVGGMADLLTTDKTTKSIFWGWTGNDTMPFASMIVPFLVSPFANKTSTVISNAVKRAAFR